MSKAERLADYCEELAKEIDHSHFTHDLLEAAAELRRLSAELEDARTEATACAERDARITEFVTALDEEMIVSHIGVFNPGDDPRKAIKDLMLWSQEVGEYFAGEKIKDRITELEEANEAFAKRQEWWDNRMVELERQLAEARAWIAEKPEWRKCSAGKMVSDINRAMKKEQT